LPLFERIWTNWHLGKLFKILRQSACQRHEYLLCCELFVPFRWEIPLNGKYIKRVGTVELGYNELGFCNALSVTLYILYYQLISHKACVFCRALYDILKNIYLRYNNIASHQFQYNFPRIKLLKFWKSTNSLTLKRWVFHYLRWLCKFQSWKMTVVTVTHTCMKLPSTFSTSAVIRRQVNWQHGLSQELKKGFEHWRES
jgi:hypothetical protein